MRIDIPPQSPPRPRASGARHARARATTFIARREARTDRNTPYDKLLASVYDAVLITDSTGRVLDFNDRALEFLQIDEKSVLGRSVIDFISGANASLLATIEHNLATYQYTVVEASCSRADGSVFPSEIAINRVNLDAEGQLCFFIRDITARTRARQDLENAVERLEALNRARLEFVSNVSHELRTPLTSMIYAVKNMQRGVAGPLPDKAMQYLDRLNADCRRLLSTVNDILDLRQIENHTLTLTRSRIPLARMVEIGVESLRVQAEEKHIQLLMCKPEQSGFVLCDTHKLERVILNIVGNAIKFTPDGGSIAVTIEINAADPNQIIVRVCDTGIGIPPEALDQIAVRYFKVGDQPIGSGLGLAISRELIELHGGKLLIDSPVPGTDHGTQVSMVLPLTPAPRVLVVSAEASLYDQIGSVCTGQGYPTSGLRNAHALLQECRQNPPDILVLDQALPDASGLDLILQIRNDRRTARMPIILFADDTLTRPHLDMLMAFQIPMIPKPSKDQALIATLNVIFYDRTLNTDRAGGTALASTVVTP
jgi:PAS domain S-box-containing protein